MNCLAGEFVLKSKLSVLLNVPVPLIPSDATIDTVPAVSPSVKSPATVVPNAVQCNTVLFGTYVVVKVTTTDLPSSTVVGNTDIEYCGFALPVFDNPKEVAVFVNTETLLPDGLSW